MKKYILLFLFAFLISINLDFAQEINKEIIDKVVEKYSPSKYKRGIIIGIVHNNSIQYFSYGESEINSDVPPDTNSIFEIGSLTSVFTTTILAEMELSGQIHLDEPVQKFLPSEVQMPVYIKIVCRPVKNVYYGIDDEHKNRPETMMVCFPDPLAHPREILLCDLATHISGLPDKPDNLKNRKKSNNPYAGYTSANLYSFLNNFELSGTSDFRYHYSNLGIALLGHALCLKTRKNFEDLLYEKIFSPLRMKDSRIKLNTDLQTRFLNGHSKNGSITPHWESEIMEASVGLHSSINDMMKFLSANIHRTETPLRNALDFAHNPRVNLFIEKKEIHATGLGWRVDPFCTGTRRVVWQSGTSGGFSSFIGFIKEDNCGVVILSNSAHSVTKTGFEILQKLCPETRLPPDAQ